MVLVGITLVSSGLYNTRVYLFPPELSCLYVHTSVYPTGRTFTYQKVV